MPPGLRDDEQEPRYDQDPIGEPGLPAQEREPGTVLSIEDLVGATVVTVSGRKIGVVAEIATTPPPELRATGLIVGPAGWLHRLRLASRLRGIVPAADELHEIPWEAVQRWDGLRIVLRDDGEPRRVTASTNPPATADGRTDSG